MPRHDLCFVGLENLPVLAPDYNHLGSGGEQVQQTLLSKAFTRRGYSVSMVVLDHGQPDGASWDGIATYRAYEPDAGVYGLRFIHPRWDGMWDAMRRADSRTYYVSCAGMRVGLAAMFCRKYGRRLVFRVAHDADCRPRETMIRMWRDRKLYEYGIRHADAILSQSLRQQSDMRANYGFESTVAGMLVERPDRLVAFGERDIDILWVNNLAPFKRPELVVELARRMPHRRIVMIGGEVTSAVDLFARVRADAATCPNLEFKGSVPYHEVNEYYSRARVFVNTSDSEGFPNSYLQAWVRGTPLVAFFDPDGVIAREGFGGVPRSMDEMVVDLDRLLAGGSDWEEAGRRARVFMDREFDEDEILKPYFAALAMGPGKS
jgi:glycosyltransferase involved in cell wall biosynthesis